MVIGIVATLVMPNMIKGLQNKIFDSRAKNAFYKLSQATDQMKVAGLLNQRYNSTAEFVDDLQKYLKITKRCSSDNIVSCFGNGTSINKWGQMINVADLKDSKGLGRKNWESETEGIVMADGTSVLLTYNVTGCEPMHEGAQILKTEGQISNTLNCLSIVLDTNSKTAPNKISKDIRALNNSLDQYKIANSNIYIDTPKLTSKSYTYEECKTIGKTNCCTHEYCINEDRWLDAYLTCEELGGHLPTEEDIITIAKDLYGDTYEEPSDYTNTFNVAAQNKDLLNIINALSVRGFWGQRQPEAANTAKTFVLREKQYMRYNSAYKHEPNIEFFCVY